jgi:hypothetical protein
MIDSFGRLAERIAKPKWRWYTVLTHLKTVRKEYESFAYESIKQKRKNRSECKKIQPLERLG